MEQKPIGNKNLSEFLLNLGFTSISLRRNVAGHLLLNATINGVDGIYMLDTGAGQTVIDNRLIEKLKLSLRLEETQLTGGGVGASGIENIPSYDNTLEINDYKSDNFIVAVMNLETAWQSLANIGAHETLYGIIGCDVLTSTDAVIDYGSMTLYLKKK